jgi:hypothetical protein
LAHAGGLNIEGESDSYDFGVGKDQGILTKITMLKFCILYKYMVCGLASFIED